jgi:hypothetical protein
VLAHNGSPLPVALTDGFNGAFGVSAALCTVGAAMALALLPARARRPEDEHTETLALSSARCPGALSYGHLAARVRATLGRPSA